MIHLAIDPQTDVALKLIEFFETQSFIAVAKEPNKETIQAINDALQGELNEYNSSDELFEKLLKPLF